VSITFPLYRIYFSPMRMYSKNLRIFVLSACQSSCFKCVGEHNRVQPSVSHHAIIGFETLSQHTRAIPQTPMSSHGKCPLCTFKGYAPILGYGLGRHASRSFCGVECGNATPLIHSSGHIATTQPSVSVFTSSAELVDTLAVLFVVLFLRNSWRAFFCSCESWAYY
jgi:hypothetical protein